MLFGFATAYSQSSLPKVAENEKQSTLPADPKLSAEDQALILNAGNDNPAKPIVMPGIDPKLQSEQLIDENAYGDANAKLADTILTDPKMKDGKLINETPVAVVPVVQSQTSNNQPQGEQAGTITDYRNQQAGTSVQAPGEPSGNIQDYRATSGSSTQPEGDKPSK